jgi:hypothetical protein
MNLIEKLVYALFLSIICYVVLTNLMSRVITTTNIPNFVLFFVLALVFYIIYNNTQNLEDQQVSWFTIIQRVTYATMLFYILTTQEVSSKLVNLASTTKIAEFTTDPNVVISMTYLLSQFLLVL